MNAIAPHPSGITGFRPGIATNSDTEGGSGFGGAMIAKINMTMSIKATRNMANQQTHRLTSPYALQNFRGRLMNSRAFLPREVRTINTRNNTREAFQSSRRPRASQLLRSTYHPIRKRTYGAGPSNSMLSQSPPMVVPLQSTT